MKQKDVALIVVIIIISAIISLVVSQAIFASPAKSQQQVEVVQAITAKFPQPDTRYFNINAFDPTRQITIGQTANPEPFSSSTQQPH